MKQTNLRIFYDLGVRMGDLEKLKPGLLSSDVMRIFFEPHAWLINFLGETEGLDIPDTRAAAQHLIEGMVDIADPMHPYTVDPLKAITAMEINLIEKRADWFEQCMDREYRYLDVFTVTPKGIYDTRLLMTRPEDKFAPRVRRMLPAQTLADLKEAARCLAFEIPTACVFHICRATEALMLAYYEVLTGHVWNLPKNRDWKAYIDHLLKEGAPKRITDRLDEIRETDRNPYTHPDLNVTLEEAPIQFELCTGMIFQMADEIDKKINP